eukprot:3453458-Alexandrium_andersonii.AAC.1
MWARLSSFEHMQRLTAPRALGTEVGIVDCFARQAMNTAAADLNAAQETRNGTGQLRGLATSRSIT